MSFLSNQILTAAQLNDLDIDSLVVDTDVLVVDKTNNRVGIGTTTPARTLHVNSGGTNAVALFESTDSLAQVYLKDGDATDGTSVGFQGTGDDLRIVAGGSVKMAIMSGGNVGIGTTSPATKFDIDTGSLGGTSGDTLKAQRWYTEAGVNDTFMEMKAERLATGTDWTTVGWRLQHQVDSSAMAFVQFNDDATGVDRGLQFGTDNNVRMTINRVGAVGINTEVPAGTLDVNGNVRATSAQISGNIFNSGVIESDGTYTNTTGSSANMHVSSGGFFFRSTSSGKYKTDVETMEDSYADAILGLRPVWYRSLCEHDPDSWSYWGFIAEEVAEIDARLVQFGLPDDYEWQYDEDGEKIEPDVADLTEPEGVQYDRIVPHLVNLLARQRDQIADLSARVTELEA